MADEPENLTLKLLREMRAEQESLASRLGEVAHAMKQIAATQEYWTSYHSNFVDPVPTGEPLKLLREMRAEQERLASRLGEAADAVTQIAATQDHHTDVLTRHSSILEHHSGLLENISEVQANNGARLNVIEGRLAIIEKHTGLVKA